MRDINKWILIFALLTTVGCEENRSLYQAYVSVAKGWEQNETIAFKVSEKVADNSKVNLFIHLRNNDQYPYSNIFLIATIKDSLRTLTTDTLEYAMTDLRGKWLGSGFSGLKESKLWWKEGYEWNDFSGIAILEIKQAMRNNGAEKGVERLPGIIDVGISIEPYSE